MEAPEKPVVVAKVGGLLKKEVDYWTSRGAARKALGLTAEQFQWCIDNHADGIIDEKRTRKIPFTQWVEKNAESIPSGIDAEDLGTLKKRHLRCRIEAHKFDMKRKRFELDVEQKKYVLMESVRVAAMGWFEDFKRLLHDTYETSLPPKQEGLRAPELATLARQTNADIINRFRSAANRFTGPPGVG